MKEVSALCFVADFSAPIILSFGKHKGVSLANIRNTAK